LEHVDLRFCLLDWGWTPEAEKDAKEAFDKAVELGIPFFDTGINYKFVILKRKYVK
jgi:aryl-alcohol dehydrogenase-like predicted oxidoreductase